MPIPWIAQLLIGVAINVIAYLIMPKPKAPKPPEIKDGEDPVAEAGMEIPVVFGSMRVQKLNVLWFGEKETVMVTMETEGGKK